MPVTAVLIDAQSIQQYLFGSNRLKENLGGSHLVKQLYASHLEAALDEAAPGHEPAAQWPFAESFSGGVKVGYIGGGNALLLFDGPERARAFRKSFSRRLLLTCPGLRTSFGVAEDFQESGDGFRESMEKLHKDLRESKNRFFPVTTVGCHGITAECPYSGEALEATPVEDKGEKRLVSALSRSRLTAAHKSKDALTKMVRDEKGAFEFSDELDKLGQKEDRGYIAVAHIDGNRMAERFKKCTSLSELRALSTKVSEATEAAFRGLISELKGLLDQEVLSAKNGFKCGDILPVRPIIIGGDDITFVSEGRLGIYLAERFIALLEKESDARGEKFTACAGVAVVKTKYPFYKAYQLADQLCSSAKRRGREKGNGSWLDFLISAGGVSGPLDRIRAGHYSASEGELCFGPYRLDSPDDDYSLESLKKGLRAFNNSEKWSKNKVMALREELMGARERCQAYVKASGLELPGDPRYSTEVWKDGKTIYFDMIDLLDFYPQSLLSEDIPCN
jgi:hypothetical protein